jgi:two-component system NtrC family sensor kinase
VESRDELGYLCNTFNLMVAAIVERDNKLKEQTQKQIAQSEKLASLGRLASGIAHEINNPLTGVLTYSSVLLEDLRDTEYREDLDVIVGETLRCRKIVQEILDFARETRLEKARVNLNRVIHDALSILEKNFNFQNIKIVRKFRDTIPEVWCDVNLFKSVINNLALNAADAMPDGGTLEIATDYNEAEDSVVLTFADTGSGISEEDLDKIFDPFFTTKETGKGTGLGLAVSYGIVQRHKGIIDVKSSPGQGTTFTIMLPVAVIDA